MTSEDKIVMLAGEGEYPLLVYNYLTDKGLKVQNLIIEKPISKKIFLRRRIKSIGLLSVIGQILHRIFIVTWLRRTSKARIQEIKEQLNLNSELPKDPSKVIQVSSVNSNECLAHLRSINPKVVVVADTRIISERILKAIPGKFINIHAGITPKYRGFHGGYWALAKNDPENCGITIHLVDKGVDTGGILYQDRIAVTSRDNYYTYPYLQLLKGLPILNQAVKDVLLNKAKIKEDPPNINSKLYYHPTIWTYLANRIIKKVK